MCSADCAQCVTTLNGMETLALVLAAGLILRFWREARRARDEAEFNHQALLSALDRETTK